MTASDFARMVSDHTTHSPSSEYDGPRRSANGGGSRMVVRGADCHPSRMKTVLIVDDHPSFRATARALLEADGYEVVGEAEDGFSAIEATTALGPDVVLLDIQLPDLDGFEVAERIVRNGSPCAIV